MERVLYILIISTIIGAEDQIFETTIQTKNGPVQGILQQSRNPSAAYVSFLGLRYADPPARFEPAEVLTEKWFAPKIAKTPGSICFQPTGGSDDCLFINLHVPSSALEDAQKQLPVMFWIHGGCFTSGKGNTYGAKYLMENEDVIVVTTNYRLGVLGFISMENDNTFTANNGLRDIVVALKWVRTNIAAFHGDPNKVTVFGNSAGSVAIHYLSMSALAKGLFHRAIMQSGAHSFPSYQPSPCENAVNLAKFLNCSDSENSKVIRTCLEKAEGVALAKAQMAFAPRWPVIHPASRFLPTAKETQENAFFAGKPSSFFTFHGKQSQYQSKVPVIIGVNRDEGSNLFTSFLLALPGQLEHLNANWSQVIDKALAYDSFFSESKALMFAEKLRDFYLGKESLTQGNLNPLINLYTDSQMLLPIMQAANDMTRSGYSIYPYIYSYVGPADVTKQFGLPSLPDHAAHASEIQQLFEHPFYGANGKISSCSKHEQFSKRMVKLWTGFADTGVPELPWDDNNTWKAAEVDENGEVILDIVELDETLTKHTSEYFEGRLDFWQKMLKEAIQAGEKQQKIDL